MTSYGPSSVAIGILAVTLGCSPERLQAVELRPNSLTRDLLAHWAFDESAGAVAIDDAGKARNGTLTGGTWRGDGRFGGALRLAEGEFVTVPDPPDASIFTGFTVSAWVRFAVPPPVQGRWGTVVSTENMGGWEVNVDYGMPPYTTTPGLHFGFWKGPNPGDYEGSTCPGDPLDHWSQIAGVSDAATSTYLVYRDGKLCTTTPATHKILRSSATLNIGQWPSGGRFLVGDVDDIAMWGRALEPAEIELLFETAVRPLP